jgi:hypothetical protein
MYWIFPNRGVIVMQLFVYGCVSYSWSVMLCHFQDGKQCIYLWHKQCNVMLKYSSVEVHWHFREMYCLHPFIFRVKQSAKQDTSNLLLASFLLDLLLDTENRGSLFLWNTGGLLSDFRALYPRRQYSSVQTVFLKCILMALNYWKMLQNFIILYKTNWHTS